MNGEQAFRSKVRGGGAWRAEVGARIDELADRLDAVPEGGGNAQKKAVGKAVETQLEKADAAMAGGGSPLGAWWTGSAITKAWEAVHNAELALLQIESDSAVLSAVPRLLSWVQRVMDAGPTREEHEMALRTEMKKEESGGKRPMPDRMKIRGALADVIAANGRRYATVRTFRNNLIIATFLLALVLLTIAVWHAQNPSFLSLCVEQKGELKECLSGGTAPAASDVWMVLLMGALGGLLGITFKLSEADDDASRFDPKTWQRLLKPVTGAATALAAVIFLQSHLLVELTIEKTKLVLLAYALIFGFSQQVLTKFVDQRAESLVKPSTK